MKILSNFKCAGSMKGIIILSKKIHTPSWCIFEYYLFKCPSWSAAIICSYYWRKQWLELVIFVNFPFSCEYINLQQGSLLMLAASRKGNDIEEETDTLNAHSKYFPIIQFLQWGLFMYYLHNSKCTIKINKSTTLFLRNLTIKWHWIKTLQSSCLKTNRT